MQCFENNEPRLLLVDVDTQEGAPVWPGRIQ